jgi:hypothetical protein
LLAATFIAVFFIPMFYRLISGRDKKIAADSSVAGSVAAPVEEPCAST